MTGTLAPPSSTAAPSRTPVLAALGIGASLVLVAVATFADVTQNDPTDNGQGVGSYLVSAAVTIVTAILVYGLVVRTAGNGNAARRSLVLGVVAFLSNVVFWAGINCVLATAAIACALIAKDMAGSLNGLAKAGMALGVITFVPAVVLAIFG